MKDELQEATARLKRYDNIDGTGEMFMGLMLLGFGLLAYLQAALPAHSKWKNGFNGLLFMYMILIPFWGVGYWLQKSIKKRFTWPRTGYVAYRIDKRTWGLLLLINFLGAAGVAAVLALLVCSAKANQLAMHAWQTGAMMTLVRCLYIGFWPLLYAFWLTRMGRDHAWKWMVLAFITLGLIVLGGVLPGDLFETSGLVMLYVGMVWLISGATTLVLYLRHTRPPVEDAE